MSFPRKRESFWTQSSNNSFLCCPPFCRTYALFTTTMFGVYAVFIFLGFGYGSFMPASMNMVYSFAGKNDSKLYMALVDTFLAPFILITIFAAAYISETFGNIQLFWANAGMLCLGLSIMIFYVKDPSIIKKEPERIIA